MSTTATRVTEPLATSAQLDPFERLARQRNWGLALVLVGWWHLLAFSFCYYLTVVRNYHDSPGYLAVWVGEILGMGLIFRLCAGSRPAAPLPPLGRFVVRIWISYFVLAFNLGSLNTLRGHHFFEFFPAMASLASFGFLVMTFAVHRRFFPAVLVMFAAGLLMAAFLLHAYLIFAVAWWIVLNGIGGALLARGSCSAATLHSLPLSVPGRGLGGRVTGGVTDGVLLPFTPPPTPSPERRGGERATSVPETRL